ncbi:MAG TPA: NAD(P)-dependent oxidoreductase [Steroidobacteraceae bacterium]|nr:NAD(P)-dependent oxidoreductase [Steroidobacteraceae bacterium]
MSLPATSASGTWAGEALQGLTLGGRSLAGKTLFVSGASRGIGLAIAIRAARDGANIVLVAKTTEPHPRLPGTLYTAAAEVEAAGGRALAVPTDIRDAEAVAAAVRAGIARFGGIDILVNNASAISLTPTPATPMSRFDLMAAVNVRGTYACTQACLPELTRSAAAGRNPQVLNLSPPLSLQPHWFAHHVAYTISKYGMSMCTLGHAEEFRAAGIAVNSLWPRTAIATAALQMIPGADLNRCRKPEILADAAWFVLTGDAPASTGNFFIDDEVLARHGITDLDRYAVVPGTKDLIPDFFLD